MVKMKVSDYFLKLNFEPDRVELGASKSRIMWTVNVYILLVLGIFARQNICFDPVISACGLGAAITGFAVFPIAMRRFNKIFRKPSWEHALLPFSIGFFFDSSAEGLKHLGKLVGL
jgi:hypothetical protein